MNDAELVATQQLKLALMEIGIEGEDIMLLAAYALQADRMNGLSVPASQASERRVVIYAMTSYAKATDESGRQSLRGDITNTATTRAKSLALIVGDTYAVRQYIGLEHGTRQLLNQCPVIPFVALFSLLKVPCDVQHLNNLLETEYMSDKRKRGHASTAERKRNKRAHVGDHAR